MLNSNNGGNLSSSRNVANFLKEINGGINNTRSLGTNNNNNFLNVRNLNNINNNFMNRTPQSNMNFVNNYNNLNNRTMLNNLNNRTMLINNNNTRMMNIGTLTTNQFTPFRSNNRLINGMNTFNPQTRNNFGLSTIRNMNMNTGLIPNGGNMVAKPTNNNGMAPAPLSNSGVNIMTHLMSTPVRLNNGGMTGLLNYGTSMNYGGNNIQNSSQMRINTNNNTQMIAPNINPLGTIPQSSTSTSTTYGGVPTANSINPMMNGGGVSSTTSNSIPQAQNIQGNNYFNQRTGLFNNNLTGLYNNLNNMNAFSNNRFFVSNPNQRNGISPGMFNNNTINGFTNRNYAYNPIYNRFGLGNTNNYTTTNNNNYYATSNNPLARTYQNIRPNFMNNIISNTENRISNTGNSGFRSNVPVRTGVRVDRQNDVNIIQHKERDMELLSQSNFVSRSASRSVSRKSSSSDLSVWNAMPDFSDKSSDKRLKNIKQIGNFYYKKREDGSDKNKITKMKDLIQKNSDKTSYTKEVGVELISLERKFKFRLEKYQKEIEKLAGLYERYGRKDAAPVIPAAEPGEEGDNGNNNDENKPLVIVKMPAGGLKDEDKSTKIEDINEEVKKLNKETMKDMVEILKEIEETQTQDTVAKGYLKDKVIKVIDIIKMQGSEGNNAENIQSNMNQLVSKMDEMVNTGNELNEKVRDIIFEKENEEILQHRNSYINFINLLSGDLITGLNAEDMIQNVERKRKYLLEQDYEAAAETNIAKDWTKIGIDEDFEIENIIEYFYDMIEKTYKKDPIETLPIAGVYPGENIYAAARICNLFYKKNYDNYDFKLNAEFNDDDLINILTQLYNSKNVLVPNSQIIEEYGANGVLHYYIYIYKQVFKIFREILNKRYIDGNIDGSLQHRINELKTKQRNAEQAKETNKQRTEAHKKAAELYKQKLELQDEINNWNLRRNTILQQHGDVAAFERDNPDPKLRMTNEIQHAVDPNQNDQVQLYAKVPVDELSENEKLELYVAEKRLEKLNSLKNKIETLYNDMLNKQKESDKIYEEICYKYTKQINGPQVQGNNQSINYKVKDVDVALCNAGLHDIYGYYEEYKELEAIKEEYTRNDGKTIGIFTSKIRNEDEFIKIAKKLWKKLTDGEPDFPCNLADINLGTYFNSIETLFGQQVNELKRVIDKIIQYGNQQAQANQGQANQQNQPNLLKPTAEEYNRKNAYILLQNVMKFPEITSVTQYGINFEEAMGKIHEFLNNNRVMKDYRKTFSNIMDELVDYDEKTKKITAKGTFKEALDIVKEIKNMKLPPEFNRKTDVDDVLEQEKVKIRDWKQKYDEDKQGALKFMEDNNIQNRKIMTDIIEKIEELGDKRKDFAKTYKELFGGKLFVPIIERMEQQFYIDKYMDMTFDENLKTDYANDIREHLDKSMEDSIKKILKSIFDMYANKLKADILYNEQRVKDQTEDVNEEQKYYGYNEKYETETYEDYFKICDPFKEEDADNNDLFEPKSIFTLMGNKLTQKEEYLENIRDNKLGIKEDKEYKDKYDAVKGKYTNMDYAWRGDELIDKRKIETFAKNYNGVRVEKFTKLLRMKYKEMEYLAKNIKNAGNYIEDYGIRKEEGDEIKKIIDDYKELLSTTINGIGDDVNFNFIDEYIKEAEQNIKRFENQLLAYVAKPFTKLVYEKFNYLNAYKEMLYFFVEKANDRLGSHILTEEDLNKITNIITSIQEDLAVSNEEDQEDEYGILDIDNIKEMEDLFKNKFGINLKRAFESPTNEYEILDNDTIPATVNAVGTMWKMMGLFKKLNGKYEKLYDQFKVILNESHERFQEEMEDLETNENTDKRNKRIKYIKKYIKGLKDIYDRTFTKKNYADYNLENKDGVIVGVDTIFNRTQVGIDIIKYMEKCYLEITNVRDDASRNKYGVEAIESLGKRLKEALENGKKDFDLENNVYDMILKNMGVNKRDDVEAALANEDNLMQINNYIIEELKGIDFDEEDFKESLIKIFKEINKAREEIQKYKDGVNSAADEWLKHADRYAQIVYNKGVGKDLKAKPTTQQKHILELIKEVRSIIQAALCDHHSEYYLKTREYIDNILTILQGENIKNTRKIVEKDDTKRELFDIILEQIKKMVKNDVVKQNKAFIEGVTKTLGYILEAKAFVNDEGKNNVQEMIRLINKRKKDYENLGKQFQEKFEKIENKEKRKNHNSREKIRSFDDILNRLQYEEYVGNDLIDGEGSIMALALNGLSTYQREYKLDLWRENRENMENLKTIKNAEYVNTFRDKMTEENEKQYKKELKDPYEQWGDLSGITKKTREIKNKIQMIKTFVKDSKFKVDIFELKDCNEIIKTLDMIEKNITSANKDATHRLMGNIIKQLPYIFDILQALNENIERYIGQLKAEILTKISELRDKISNKIRSANSNKENISKYIKVASLEKLKTVLKIVRLKVEETEKLNDFNMSTIIIEEVDKDIEKETQKSVNSILAAKDDFNDMTNDDEAQLKSTGIYLNDLKETPKGGYAPSNDISASEKAKNVFALLELFKNQGKTDETAGKSEKPKYIISTEPSGGYGKGLFGGPSSGGGNDYPKGSYYKRGNLMFEEDEKEDINTESNKGKKELSGFQGKIERRGGLFDDNYNEFEMDGSGDLNNSRESKKVHGRYIKSKKLPYMKKTSKENLNDFYSEQNSNNGPKKKIQGNYQ